MLSVVRFSKIPAAAVLLACGFAFTTQTLAQAPVPPGADVSAMSDALNALQPTLSGVNLAVTSVEVHRWKVPGDVKDTTNSDIQSIVRDLSSTLPGLVSQAQATPASIAPAFAVYRNIDALYDVLLRVTETATLAGSQQEAGRLESARADLQTRRSQLGNALLSSAVAQDSNVVQLKTSLATMSRLTTPATADGPRKIVVNDGPAPSAAKTTHKKKTIKPASSSSSAAPAATSSAPQQ